MQEVYSFGDEKMTYKEYTLKVLHKMGKEVENEQRN